MPKNIYRLKIQNSVFVFLLFFSCLKKKLLKTYSIKNIFAIKIEATVFWFCYQQRSSCSSHQKQPPPPPEQQAVWVFLFIEFHCSGFKLPWGIESVKLLMVASSQQWLPEISQRIMISYSIESCYPNSLDIASLEKFMQLSNPFSLVDPWRSLWSPWDQH